MPIATLSFTLPEEREEFRLTQDGVEWYLLVQELLQHIRSKTKHGELSEEQYAAYDNIRDSIVNLANERNLSLE